MPTSSIPIKCPCGRTIQVNASTSRITCPGCRQVFTIDAANRATLRGYDKAIQSLKKLGGTIKFRL